MPTKVIEDKAKAAYEDMQRRYAAKIAECEELRSQLVRANNIISWVESWVCNPVGSYSSGALDGLFGMTRDKIAALTKKIGE